MRRSLSSLLSTLFARICLIILLVCPAISIAQVQPSYFTLGEKEFDGVQIYDVIQDDNLNYWIATDNGIYKYDSYSFTRIDCPGAQSPAVFGFVKNLTGKIYCYNLNNQVIQIADGACSVMYELKPEERSADIYLSITPQNELLVLTKTVLLFGEDGTAVNIPRPRIGYYGFPFETAAQKTIIHLADSDSLLVCDNRNFQFVRLNTAGHYMVGVLKFFTLNSRTYAISSSGKEIYLFKESDYSLELMPPTDLAKTKEPFRIYDVNNQVWTAGIISGVRVLSDNGGLSLSQLYYSQYLISDVFRDAEGNLLLSTFNHGILVVPDVNVPDVLDVPGGHAIMSIQSDDKLGMLMGTLTGKLLSFNNGVYRTLSDSGSRPLQSIFSWPAFPFVIYDDGGIKALNKETGAVTQVGIGSLKDALYINDSTIYLALNIGLTRVTWTGGNSFEVSNVTAIRLRCYALAYSAPDNLIYVSASDGVRMFAPGGTVLPLLQNGTAVFANDIASSDGVIYLATRNGILKCSGGTITETIQTVIQGKAVEVLKLDVQNGIISAITAAGFARFDLEGNLQMQLNSKQGFSTNRIYDFDNSGDEIWICHSQGVQKLSTAILSVPVTKPLMRISALNVNDQAESLLNAGIFTSEERKFCFTLSSPTLRNKENIRYHYQLSGYDETWFLSDYADNEIIYNALAPGDYTFTVKAENSGVFSDPVSYSFTITSPFYSRWWFSALIGVLLLLVITFVYRYRLQLQEKKANLENELHASRLTAIQSQMNPHFIFNSLNSIQDLVLKGDVDNSYTFITKFSNLVRRTLNYSDKDFVEFGQEIKLLELYLSLEKLRFRDDLEFTLETGGIDDIMIPPMLIQPFIENSLLHGLLHKEGKKQIIIRFHLNENLVCTIEDNGIGREKAKEIKNRQRAEHESFAGQAIKKRFSILSRLFNKSDLGFVYTDLYEGNVASGTRVTLTIPVKRSF